jgi:FkbM family methyltransferase
MSALQANSSKLDLTQLQELLRSLVTDIDLGADDQRCKEAAVLSDALIRVTNIVSEIQSLHDYYASLACRVAALEGERLATDTSPYSAYPAGSRSSRRAAAAIRALWRASSSRLAPIAEFFISRSKTRRAYDEQLQRLLAERDIFLSRIQELEGPGAIFSSARQASDSAFSFPAAIIREIDKPEIAVVDVGSQNRDSETRVYAPLMRAGSVKVIRLEALNDEVVKGSEDEPSTVLKNYVIGHGGPANVHITKFNRTSSLFEPDVEFLRQFWSLADMFEAVETREATTTKLDDVEEIKDCDFLKIDVQGGELDVIKGSLRLLEGAILVQTKVEFAPIFRNQPLFSDIDVLLRELSFDLIDFVSAGYNSYAALRRPLSRSRLLWADAIYFKSPVRLEPQKLLKAAYIAHINYGMYDLAADYLQHYDKHRGAKLAEAYNLAVR